jgi:hypothetical protein
MDFKEIMEYLIVIPALINIFIAGYLLYYFSYFKKKGENLATKEDIGELTEITEKIKGEVDVISQNRMSLYSEKRNAVISFLECANEIESFLIFKVQGGMSKEDLIQNYLDKFDKSHHLADVKLRLYFNDPKLDVLLDEFDDLMVRLMQLSTEIYNNKLSFKENKDVKIILNQFEKLQSKLLEYFKQFVRESTQ